MYKHAFLIRAPLAYKSLGGKFQNIFFYPHNAMCDFVQIKVYVDIFKVESQYDVVISHLAGKSIIFVLVL